MIKPLIVANWKATKTIQETSDFIKKVKPLVEDQDINVILCPSFTALESAKVLLDGSKIKLGAQNVSKFKKGSYTGEVTIEMIDGIVSHCIVGHSERKKYFGETNEDILEKLDLLMSFEITPILCISDILQLSFFLQKSDILAREADKIIFVYEPPNAISGGGSYKPEDPKDVASIAQEIGEKIGKKVITLYGGSINPENAQSFFSLESIDGGLIGQASTDPHSLLKILNI